ncbi:unnamed protein product [Kuraishia capsulata CBS 1993]|uniref:MIP18 family-like domain-containing protein n=1 Tax=Kuraishia capsulata CBS 1993 TaxID=1382522 RepID=W6MG72_9ASCO|nr:uncharacterized protein KUCA_T00000431001 [Kuraishia capsulata CBS 1993]CDK24468.1 unnamed protein product [Kuraishia capsulata CBS 1993]
MSGDIINANPTVLDVSQLPTRREKYTKESAKGGQSDILLLNNLLSLSLLTPSGDLNENKAGQVTPPELTDDETEAEEEEAEDPIDAQEIYDLISSISDPEHPLTLGQLAVVNLNDITVTDPRDPTKIGEVLIKITPTITHCSLATLIGLGIRVRLERSLPPRLRIKILLKEGSHQSENQVNKQLNDKERVCAACENEQLLKVITHMLSTCI